MEDFKNGPKGLICPWCSAHPPIHTCQHNPFQLMDEVESLRKQLNQSDHIVYHLRELLSALSDKGMIS